MAVFLAFVLDDHLTPPRYHAEPLGLFLFICCLGTIAVRRVVRNERRLVAIEQEMAAAWRIQSSILPEHEPSMPGLNTAVRYALRADGFGGGRFLRLRRGR